MSSLNPMITVRRLLKSCAIPPASRPIASIFCAWRNCASRLLRWVMSVAIPQIAYTRSEEPRLNSSHLVISYAVFCLKKKKNQNIEKELNEENDGRRMTEHVMD